MVALNTTHSVGRSTETNHGYVQVSLPGVCCCDVSSRRGIRYDFGRVISNVETMRNFTDKIKKN